MQDHNSCSFIGNLTRDPQTGYSGDTAWARFSIAVNRGNDRNGKDKGADFVSIVTFGKTAENVGKYLKKGSKVFVEGRYETNTYEKDGEKRTSHGINARSIQFLPSGNGEKSQKGNGNAELPPGFEPVAEGDIPF